MWGGRMARFLISPDDLLNTNIKMLFSHPLTSPVNTSCSRNALGTYFFIFTLCDRQRVGSALWQCVRRMFPDCPCRMFQRCAGDVFFSFITLAFASTSVVHFDKAKEVCSRTVRTGRSVTLIIRTNSNQNASGRSFKNTLRMFLYRNMGAFHDVTKLLRVVFKTFP